ncbi:hypothetical protein [Paenibacillus sp. sgz302251]|uniref:hypothetical protein n=1 Tax=Paenibacillus sp. sgz302251 TaxID=3414493 RepID=UPI003C7E814C
MEVRHTTNPTDVKQYTTERLRSEFLIESLFVQDQMKMTYTHYDRMVVGGAFPVNETLELEAAATLKTEYFLERCEVGFLNIGGAALISVDGETYELNKLDVLKRAKIEQFATGGALCLLLNGIAKL